MGDVNGWIGDRTRAGITGVFGVPGKNYIGRRVAEFCEERGLVGSVVLDVVAVRNCYVCFHYGQGVLF